ncbi:uncharacterized protein LOC6569064 isoform X1 [Drosophila grimshawi]|uniref:uncharacterized protein LOC6569064 isoform X1 n=1 Tax=Drosophila grimshawi TaxID=7222 RepID=UPI000C86F0A1|nr:uncharacterized protein LOC6569064 isoform X1 [Drosophila grimshawi]
MFLTQTKIRSATMPPSVSPQATPPENSDIFSNHKTDDNDNKIEDSNGDPQRKAWERELIGSFLLKMAEEQVVSARRDWFVDKRILRCKFEEHLQSEPKELRTKLTINGPYNIGTLLKRTNFLMNTPRGDYNYRIKNLTMMEFRKEKCNNMEENQRQNDPVAVSSVINASLDDDSITQKYVLDDSAELVALNYEKTQIQKRNKNFELNSMGCYICQCNFESIEKYEEHIEYHGDESEFESLRKMEKYAKPMLKLSYQSCVDSHYFGFTLATQLKDIVIEKIIIVQSRQFYYVYNHRLPVDISDNGQMIFFVDSHVFMILREQPIVIGYSQLVKGERKHYVEQHHFMRTEALPNVIFNVNPYRLSKGKQFKGGHLEPAIPPDEVLKAVKLNAPIAQKQLVAYNQDYGNYCDLGKILTPTNLYGALGTLLQVEDIERIQSYVALKHSKMELHQFGKDLSVKLRSNTASANTVLSPGDDVLIINERCTNSIPKGPGMANSVCQLLDNNELQMKLALMEFDALVRWGHATNKQFGEPEKNRKEPRIYFARILGVSDQRVNITCDRSLPDNTTFTLIFRPLRSIQRYQYRALEQLKSMNADHVQRLLFPQNIDRQPLAKGALRLNNLQIGCNFQQLRAVQQIALADKLPAPYIILGPPGTGKTATICEAIYQLYVERPETHILVLAGSNTACDEIALRLLRCIAKVNNGQSRPLVRVFSASCDRRIDGIDDLLLEYSNMYSAHFYPAVEAVHDYRIVVCTLSLAGKLSTGGFGSDECKRKVFSHVFVDEAAASTEPEVLMGIACTIAPTTNLILSGDHKQLGAVLQSQRAGDWGLGVSLFERLIQRDCYGLDENGDYNAAVQTRLVHNYRSHPEIVALYNGLYYNSELKSKAPLKNVDLAKNWFHAPNADFPIIFHSVFGAMNQQSSKSLCNNKEIDAVMDYVKDLMYLGINGEKLAQTDIGIISPYKNQYQRIQEQLNMRNWHQIDCGSVESFQGKEKQIIIVSFVRSFTEYLGFLNNSRRLNVLLSRPMSLLILIGNPRTLSKNEEFRHIIDICRIRKTLVGSPYYPDDNKTNEANAQSDADNNTNNLKNGYRQKIARINNTNNNNCAQSLGQTFKRTTKPRSKAVYNKKLVELSTLVAKKSELEEIFDELPSVPTNGDSDTDSEPPIRSEMQNLTINMPPVTIAPRAPRLAHNNRPPPPVNVPPRTMPQPSPRTMPQPSPRTMPQPPLRTMPQPSPWTMPQPPPRRMSQPSPWIRPQPSPLRRPQPSPLRRPQPPIAKKESECVIL